MDRKTPDTIAAILRSEVNFGCPVCGNPYLTYHHFNPPWAVKNHHEPAGMIALCQEHHDKADAGAFTNAQLMQLKLQNKKWSLKGTFDWRRYELVAYIGSNVHYGDSILFSLDGTKIIWYERDPNGYLLLNIDLLSRFNLPFVLRNNAWSMPPILKNFHSPPAGKLLEAEFLGGQKLKIQFHEIKNEKQLHRAISSRFIVENDTYPITLVTIEFYLNKSFYLGKRETRIGGMTSQNNIHGKGFYVYTQ